MRQRPTLPGRLQPSTIGVLRLNFCVRNGNRWNPQAITTAMGEQDRGGRSVSVLPFRTLFSAESSSYLSVWHFLSSFLRFRSLLFLDFLPFGFLSFSSSQRFRFLPDFRAFCIAAFCPRTLLLACLPFVRPASPSCFFRSPPVLRSFSFELSRSSLAS